MSWSMTLGRVVLPALGLAVALTIGWQAYRTGRVELPAWLAPESGKPGRPALAPAKAEGPRKVAAEGRVVAYPGSLVTVGAEAAGTVSRVQVVEKSAVRKGDLLVSMKADDVKAQLDEAAANLVEAEAEVARIEADERRMRAAPAKNAPSGPDMERTHSYVVAYRARRDALKASRARLDAQWRKHWSFAPIDGVVTARSVHPGETVAAGAPLVTIVDLARLRVEAEVDEYDVAHCAPGDPVAIRSEAYPGRSWPGVVEEVADALAARKSRPEDPARPTDTGVLPVRISFRAPTPLRLNQRVRVEIAARPATDPVADSPGLAVGSRPAAR